MINEPWKRRTFVQTVMALMFVPKIEPFKVIDKPVVAHEIGNLRKRLMRMSTLREAQLMRFRALIKVSTGSKKFSVLAAPFTQMGRVKGLLSWQCAELNALRHFIAHGIELVDDQGFILKSAPFSCGQVWLNGGDSLRATYSIDGIMMDMPLRDWPDTFTLGDWNINSNNHCPRIDVAHYLAQNRATA